MNLEYKQQLEQKIKLRGLGIRPNSYSIGELAKYPNSIYLVQRGDSTIVGSTTPRLEVSGEKVYSNIDEAEQDFLRRLEADKRLTLSAEKTGKTYPPLPY